MSRAAHMTTSAASVVLAAAVGAGALPAAAAPLEHEQFEEHFTGVYDDCEGLTYSYDVHREGMVLFNSRKPGAPPYWMSTVRATSVYTNLATGKTLTEYLTLVDKDLQITDNGDGTLTILVLGTGGLRVYGPDGKLLLLDPGQVRYEVLIDHGGTPDDPYDDEFLEFLGIVKGSTGRSDLFGTDFCEVMATYTS